MLFAGDVVMNESFVAAGPASSMKAWLAAFDTFAAFKPHTVVPAHGAVGPGTLIADESRVDAAGARPGARAEEAQGKSIDETADRGPDRVPRRSTRNGPARSGLAALARVRLRGSVTKQLLRGDGSADHPERRRWSLEHVVEIGADEGWEDWCPPPRPLLRRTGGLRRDRGKNASQRRVPILAPVSTHPKARRLASRPSDAHPSGWTGRGRSRDRRATPISGMSRPSSSTSGGDAVADDRVDRS